MDNTDVSLLLASDWFANNTVCSSICATSALQFTLPSLLHSHCIVKVAVNLFQIPADWLQSSFQAVVYCDMTTLETTLWGSRHCHSQQTRTSQSQRLIKMSNLKVSEEEEKSSTMQIQLRHFIKLIKDNKNLSKVNGRRSWKCLDRFWASQSFQTQQLLHWNTWRHRNSP